MLGAKKSDSSSAVRSCISDEGGARGRTMRDDPEDATGREERWRDEETARPVQHEEYEEVQRQGS